MYFTSLTDNRSLSSSFYEIYNAIIGTLPQIKVQTGHLEYPMSVCRNDYRYHMPISEFIQTIAQIERLNFLNDPKTAHTFNLALYKPRPYTLEQELQRTGADQYKTGFIICQNFATRYTEIENSTHLPAAETQFKVTPTHFLKIFTINNTLFVYTNKDLPFDTIIKLKILQWSLFKNNIENVNPDIDKLLNALYTKNIDEANTAINSLLSIKELAEMKYEDLKDLFKPNHEIKIQEKERNITRLESDYIKQENYLSELVRRINELQEELTLLYKLNEQEYDATPIIKFLIKHPYIKSFRKWNSNTLEMYFESPVVYFDKYIIDKIIRNYSDEKKIILQAFKDEKYELMTRCKIRFETNLFQVSFDHIGTDKLLGHPHIDQMGCFGNHGTAIRDCAKEGDHLGAIEQISQATLNVNFADGVVVRRMLENLIYYGNHKTWRSKETGVMISTNELIEEYRS